VHCQDGLGYADYDEYAELHRLGERLSPNFAGISEIFRLPCSGMVSPVNNAPGPLPRQSLPPLAR
jgi:hypothetical protein